MRLHDWVLGFGSTAGDLGPGKPESPGVQNPGARDAHSVMGNSLWGTSPSHQPHQHSWEVRNLPPTANAPQGRWHLDPNVPPDVLFLHPHFWLPQTCLESFLPPCLPPRHLLPIPTHTELITGHAGGFPVPSQ